MLVINRFKIVLPKKFLECSSTALTLWTKQMMLHLIMLYQETILLISLLLVSPFGHLVVHWCLNELVWLHVICNLLKTLIGKTIHISHNMVYLLSLQINVRLSNHSVRQKLNPNLKAIKETSQVSVVIQALRVKHSMLIQQLKHDEVHKCDLQCEKMGCACQTNNCIRYTFISCQFKWTK